MPMDSIPMTASRLSALILSMHIYYHMHSDSHVPLGSHTHMPANMCIQRSGGHGKFLERERETSAGATGKLLLELGNSSCQLTRK